MPRGQKERPWQPAEGKCIRADVLRGIQPRLAAVALDGARGLLRRSPDRKNRARPALAHGMHDTNAKRTEIVLDNYGEGWWVGTKHGRARP